MKNGAWRLDRLLFCTLSNTLIALPLAAADDTAADFVRYYQNAYAQGRDLIPAAQTPLDTSSISAHLDLQTIRPKGTLSGSAFLASDGTIVRLAGVEGCVSTEPMEFAGLPATCATISLAGMSASLTEATAGAGGAFPCHLLGQNPGRPTIRFAECFFTQDGTVNSLSEALISKGLAFAARDRAGRPIFPEYVKTENAARSARAGIWANAHFVHPYGERYRANPSTN